MDYPTEFIPIYDQTQEQAKKMVDKLFEENAEIRARLAMVKEWREKHIGPLTGWGWREGYEELGDILAKRTEEK